MMSVLLFRKRVNSRSTEQAVAFQAVHHSLGNVVLLLLLSHKRLLTNPIRERMFFWTKSINHWFNAESLTYFGWMGLFARIVAAKNRVTLEPKTIVGKRIYQLYVSSIPQLATTINFSCFLERDCNLDQKLSRHHQERNYWVTQRYRKA